MLLEGGSVGVVRRSSMAIYRKGEGLWSRGISAAVLFGTALFGCRRLAATLGASGWSWPRRALFETPFGALTGAWLVAGLLLAACVAGLWVLMNHVRAVDFLVEMEGELRKVSWPVDRAQPKPMGRYRELIQSSFIVIISVLVMGVALFLYDWVLGHGVQRILGV